jgi:hypothetical protein
MSGERRGKRGWIVVGLVVVCLGIAAMFFVRGFGGVHFVPITRAQIDAINGQDLKWVGPVQTKTITAAELGELGKGIRYSDFSGYSYPARPWAESKDKIRATVPVTDKLLTLIANKEIAIPPDKVFDPMDGGAVDFPSFAQWKAVAKLIAAQIGLEAELGDRDRCFKACMAGLAYDNFLVRSPITEIIDYLVRVAVSAILLTAVEKAASSGVFTAAQLEVLYSQISPAATSDAMLASAMLYEWDHRHVSLLSSLKARDVNIMVSSSTGRHAEDGVEDSYLECGELDMPATVAQAARILRVRLKNCALPWDRQDLSANREVAAIDAKLPPVPELQSGDNWLKQTWEKSKYRAKMRALPNSIGLQLVSMVSSLDCAEGSFRNRTAREGHRLSLLIELYRQTHGGQLPPDLASLHPLSRKLPFPIDLFGGGDFHYSPGRRMFWSVGKDGVDSGGVMGSNRYNGPDMVFSLR